MQNNWYPININIFQKNIVVIGGGVVAERKVINLLACGAFVTVVSPKITEYLNQLLKKNKILYKERKRGKMKESGSYSSKVVASDIQN